MIYMEQKFIQNSNLIHDGRKIGMLTDVGRVRKIDEDSIMASEMSFGIDSKDYKLRLLVVADGMGGHAKGEEASKIALNAISRTVLSRLFDGVQFTKLLEAGIQNANQDILNHVDKYPETSGMGTTSVCALLENNKVHIANIGDSRAYVISNDGIRRITKDHSYVQELIDEGQITDEESRTHPKKNVITKAIGAATVAEPDTLSFTLDLDESLLLCCDGVIAHLTDDDIHEIIVNSDDPHKACQKIVDVANERGGTDNISLIILSAETQNKNNSLSDDDDIPTIITT